jgi:hypothetical protein
MSKKSKKATRSLAKSVRKAVKRHSIATGVLTGAATAVALSTTGATRRMSEAVGSGVAGLLKVSGKRNDVIRNLKKKTADALERAGRSLQPEAPATDAKTSNTSRRPSSARATS